MDENTQFDQILHETQLQVRAFIRGMGVAASDVDDIAQDVYLQFYNDPDKKPDDVEPVRWLKGIARNLCLAHFRSQKSEKAHSRAALAEFLSDAESEWEAVQGRPNIIDILKGCLQKISPKQREIVKFRYDDELDAEQISSAAGMTAAAVRKALHRVRVALKDCVMGNLT